MSFVIKFLRNKFFYYSVTYDIVILILSKEKFFIHRQFLCIKNAPKIKYNREV